MKGSKMPKKIKSKLKKKNKKNKNNIVPINNNIKFDDNETYKTSEEIEIDKLNCFLKEKCREIENFAQESKLRPDHMYYNLLFYVKQSAIYNLSYPYFKIANDGTDKEIIEKYRDLIYDKFPELIKKEEKHTLQ